MPAARDPRDIVDAMIGNYKWGVLEYVGAVFFISVVVYNACTYGTLWEIGRFYMPRPILHLDPVYYPDGTEVDMEKRKLALTDGYEITMLVMLIISLVCLAGVMCNWIRLRSAYLRRLKLDVIYEMAMEAQAEGRRQDVIELAKRYEQLAGPLDPPPPHS